MRSDRSDAWTAADTRWLIVTLATGGVLRALVLVRGPLMGGDGTLRLLRAITWAHAPVWEGLTGIWPPLHWYALGSLVRLWPHPLFWSYSLGFLSELGTIYLMFRTTKCLYGDTVVAGLSAALLAVYWIHASLVGSNFVEVYYLFFVMLGVYCCAVCRRDARRWRLALGGGAAFAVALLLRHEAKLLWPVLMLYLWDARRRRAALVFAIPSALAFGWQLVEPVIGGQGYAAWTHDVSAMKALDQVVMHQTMVDALKRWIVMPAATPSFVVVVLGLLGIWLRRRHWRQELFLWLLLVQVAFYFTMTIAFEWNPQQRYLMLYLINLLPFAAVALRQLWRRSAWAAVAIVAVAVSVQAGAWDLVSRTPLPWGLVPAQAESTSQIALERWMRAAPPRTEIYEVAPCAPRDHAFHTIECSWDADVATLRANRTDLTPVLQPTPEELARLSAGHPIAFPPDAVVLVNPRSPVYPSVVAQMPAQRRTEFDDGSLQIVRTGP